MHPNLVGEAVDVAIAIENCQRLRIQNRMKVGRIQQFLADFKFESKITK